MGNCRYEKRSDQLNSLNRGKSTIPLRKIKVFYVFLNNFLGRTLVQTFTAKVATNDTVGVLMHGVVKQIDFIALKIRKKLLSAERPFR